MTTTTGTTRWIEVLMSLECWTHGRDLKSASAEDLENAMDALKDDVYDNALNFTDEELDEAYALLYAEYESRKPAIKSITDGITRFVLNTARSTRMATDNNKLELEAKKAFCEGFESRIQELVPDFDYYADGNHSPAPWCAPWTWGYAGEYLPEGMSAEDAGKRWAEECAPEIAKAVAEELEARKEAE